MFHRGTLQESQTIQFACDNSNETFAQIKFFIEQYYNLTSMRQIFVDKQSEKITSMQPDFEQTSQIDISFSTQPTNSYSKHRFVLIDIFSFLLTTNMIKIMI